MSQQTNSELQTAQASNTTPVRNVHDLPKNMFPSQEAFEKVGFIFKDTDDPLFVQASLPEGWELKYDDTDGLHYFVDQKGRTRGTYISTDDEADENIGLYRSIGLFIRFYTFYSSNDGRISVYDEDKVIYTAGICKSPCSPQYFELIDDAKAYLAEHYPEWKDPTKYWDD